MSRFTDRLEADLEQIAERATPSPTAWHDIHERMAEPSTDHAREIIMLTAEPETENLTPGGPGQPQRRTWILTAAALALLVGAVGVFFGTREDSGDVITDGPADQTSVVEQTTTSTTAAPEPEPEPEPAEAEARPILPGFTMNPGLHGTDTLGMKMQLEVAEPMQTSWLRPGEFQLRDIETESRFIVIARLGGWLTLDQAIDPTLAEEGSITPGDIEAWIADNQIIAEQRPDTVVDGRPAVVYDLRLDAEVEGSLDPNGKVTGVYTVAPPSFDPTTAADPSRTIVPELGLRLWLVDVDGFAPIIIFGAVAGPDAAWLDEFEQTILPTIDFGPDAPPMTP